MKPLLILLFVLCLLSGCRSGTRIPPDVMPVNKMKMIVWEMEMADQKASGMFLLSKDSLRMESTSLYQQVFAKYKTNKAAFYKSFAFYESNPDIMKVLFDSASAYGNRQKAEAYKKAY